MTGPISQKRIPVDRKLASVRLFVLMRLCLWLAGGVFCVGSSFAQPPQASSDVPGGESPPDKTRAAVSATDSVVQEPEVQEPETEQRVRELIDGLRSGRFARRETASEQLYQIGRDAIPALRVALQSSDDEEQKHRLVQIIDLLADKDLELRIDEFLKGGEPELENWSEFEKWFSDTPRSRELFVELYRAHPYLVRSLGGTPQQLALGVSNVFRDLLERDIGRREIPQRVDLIALLLPIVEGKFKAGIRVESYLAGLLSLYPASDLRNDPVFGKPFLKLVGVWMAASDRGVRRDVLRLALQWDMDVALGLALQTLKEEPDPILLCRVMQTIAKQGNPQHAPLLAPYLEDPTIVFQRRYLGRIGGEVQIGDVAAAAIAKLHNTPVTDIGFAEPAEHHVLGIVFEELVIPVPAAKDGEGNAQIPGGIQPPGPLGPDPNAQELDIAELRRRVEEAAKQQAAARGRIRRSARKLLGQTIDGDAPEGENASNSDEKE